MKMAFSELLGDPKKLLTIYKNLINDPKSIFSQINENEKLEHSLVALALIMLISSITSVFSPWFTPLALLFGMIFMVVASCICSGILHLLRGFLQAQGDFTKYLSFTAWITLLLLPINVALGLLTSVSGIAPLATLQSAVMLVFWFYAFHKVFQSDFNKTTVITVVLLILTAGPSALMNSVDTSKYSRAALEAQNPDFEKRMAELEKLQEELRQREAEYEQQDENM